MNGKIIAAATSAALLFAAPAFAKSLNGSPTGVANSALGGKAAHVPGHRNANGIAHSTINAKTHGATGGTTGGISGSTNGL